MRRVRISSTSILLDTTDQRHYLLRSGRWFRGPSLTDGPWEYVAHDKLPAAFAKIPETHPRGVVLASVPGTPQAQEALIDNSIPQTAEVNRTSTTYRATYEGAPKFQPVEGTPLHYAVNTPDPVINAALSLGVDLRIETKYWMEQMGLPFHPMHVNPQDQRNRRHGYANFLRYPQRLTTHHALSLLLFP